MLHVKAKKTRRAVEPAVRGNLRMKEEASGFMEDMQSGAYLQIEAGLQELIKKRNRELLVQELGSFDIELSLSELRKLRAEQ